MKNRTKHRLVTTYVIVGVIVVVSIWLVIANSTT